MGKIMMFFLAALLLIASPLNSLSADPTTYSNDSYGYQLEIPANWLELSQYTINHVLSQPETNLPKEAILAVKDAVSTGRNTIFFEDIEDQTGAVSIVVTIENDPPAINEQFRQHVADSIVNYLKENGFNDVRVRQSKLLKLNNRLTVLTECAYRIYYEEEMVTFRQIQYIIPGGGKHFIIGCTAPSANFSRYLPAFKHARDSFRLVK